MKNYIRWQNQLLECRKNNEIKSAPGCYNVFLENKKTGVIYETQGDIPDDPYYDWSQFLIWLVDEIAELVGTDEDDDLNIISLEYD